MALQVKGFLFGFHTKNLERKPDIVLSKYKN
jgi:G:T-mismatch repair DNA endonuclease (very short patch repair protein)